jgi:hypothetical protein
MRWIFSILVLVLSSAMLSGQTYAWKMDSLTKAYLKKLPKSKQINFDPILSQRLVVDLLSRIDTHQFDYAFIEENFCYADTSGVVEERYFKNGDSIPCYVYFNGQFSDPKVVYDGTYSWYSKDVRHSFTFSPMYKKYSRLKPRQGLPYDREQIWEHGCVTFENDDLDFIKDRTEQLKTTYQIQTLIDKRKQKIMVSIQLAPPKPKFKMVEYNPAWAW